MRRRLIFGMLALVMLGAAGAAFILYQRVHQPYMGFDGPEQFVDIPTGTSIHDIGARLVQAGVIRDPLTFRLAVRVSGEERRLQAGEYRFDRPMTPVEVVRKLARGDVYLLSITFPEGLTIKEMARLYESRGFGSAEDFLAAARDEALIAALDLEATDLEGYLFPETYALRRRTPAEQLVRRMVSRFQEVFTAELRAEAEASGMTVREVVTLASLIEKETAKAPERPIVGAVYRNRLERGMGLQCDPTVIYALERAGRYDGNLTRADLLFDSPYNTYRYAGLPPGPIAAPGRHAIEAALRPADVPYLYFVSRNDGSHEFAATLEEHNRNVHRYQVRYFRERRRVGRTDGRTEGPIRQ